MDWGGESAAVKWEVGPTDGVVEALIQTLVDPRLPRGISVAEAPTEDVQKSVARQMHAVVLLYNYYHRKQKLDLKFLDFISFCKLAVSVRPSLTPFMKMIKEDESVELNGTRDPILVTEKAIKDACDIAKSLDASKNVPVIDGWPISKVAVLLIDSKKENCWLQFGAVTDGVWSLIEKEINESSIDKEILVDERMHRKRKMNNQHSGSKFQQIAFDAVKDATGFDSSRLVILKTHVVYSLSKVKSAAQFYMIQCPKSFSLNQTVPLKFLVESLRGPLADRFLDVWATTTLIEYHHMLPYVGFISDWLSGKDSCLPTLSGYDAMSKKESPRSKIPALPRPEYSCNDLDHIATISSELKISSSKETASEISEDNQNKSKPSGGKIAKIFQSKKGHGNASEELKNSDIFNSAEKGGNRIAIEKLDNEAEQHERRSSSHLSGGLSEGISRDNVMKRVNEQRKKLNSKDGVYHQTENHASFAQHAHVPKDGVNLKSEIAPTENALVQSEALYDMEVNNALDSEDLQNALALVDMKRQQLYSRICTMEDELALYEHSIERIRDDGEVGLARQCIKSILSGSKLLLIKNEVPVQDKGQSEMKTGFSYTYLLGESSCQDLEYTCLKNNWRLPRYFVQPSDGKFVADVVLQSKDFNLSSKGVSECSAREARESAAAEMMGELRSVFAST